MSYTFFKNLALFNLLEAHSIGNYLYLYSLSNPVSPYTMNIKIRDMRSHPSNDFEIVAGGAH